MSKEQQNGEVAVANITTLGLVAKTSKAGAHSMALPNRTEWARGRGLKPGAAETRRQYAEWARGQAVKAEACVNAFIKGGSFQYVRHVENKSGDRITVTYAKPREEASSGSGKLAKVEAERDQLQEQLDAQAEELERLKAMVTGLLGVNGQGRAEKSA